MIYFNCIDYIGDPPKVVMPSGDYLNTMMASDIPVTDLNTWEFFANYKFCNPGNKYGLPKIELSFTGIKEQATFIGESIVIYNLLDEMRANSRDANSMTFRIEVSDNRDGEHVSIKVSDDGKGIGNTNIAESLFLRPITTKDYGMGVNLLIAAGQAKRIGGDVKYKGVGIDGKGASFEMTFLKKMPA